MGEFDLSLLEKGGPIMWVLLGMSLIGFLVFVERVVFTSRPDPFIRVCDGNQKHRA